MYSALIFPLNASNLWCSVELDASNDWSDSEDEEEQSTNPSRRIIALEKKLAKAKQDLIDYHKFVSDQLNVSTLVQAINDPSSSELSTATRDDDSHYFESYAANGSFLSLSFSQSTSLTKFLVQIFMPWWYKIKSEHRHTRLSFWRTLPCSETQSFSMLDAERVYYPSSPHAVEPNGCLPLMLVILLKRRKRSSKQTVLRTSSRMHLIFSSPLCNTH